MVVEVIVKGGKKYKALKKLLEVVSKEPEKEFLWSDLVRIIVSMGISYPYSSKIITELIYLGVLNKIGDRYTVDVEKLKEIVESQK
jgi:tRNA G26 N,N-dimethylase Trm1